MSIEVSCGNCQGRLLIEQPGVVVACPHCGTHLTIDVPAEPASEVTATPEAVAEAEAEAEAAAEAAAEQAPAPVFDAPVFDAPVFDAPVFDAPVFDAPVPDAPAEMVAEPATSEFPGEPMPYLGDATPPGTGGPSVPMFDPNAQVVSPGFEPAVAFQTGVATAGGSFESAVTGPASAEPLTVPVSSNFGAAISGGFATSGFATASPAPATASPAPATASPAPATPVFKSDDVVPKRLFKMAVSYGVAATLAVLYLSFLAISGATQKSQLESLPDTVPPKSKTKSGEVKIGYQLIPEDMEVPPGHLLALGEEQRFGNLLVTPLHVERSPIEFVYFSGENNGRTKPPGKDVLKLWIRFENVSTDQEIAPLSELIFRRGTAKGDEYDDQRSNTFLCRKSQKTPDGERVLAYELNTNDLWILKDQQVELELKPGESIETYIPTTEEGLSELLSEDEPLVWRVHFRKGYSPKNYGVTTVFEVKFDRSDIRGRSA